MTNTDQAKLAGELSSELTLTCWLGEQQKTPLSEDAVEKKHHERSTSVADVNQVQRGNFRGLSGRQK